MSYVTRIKSNDKTWPKHPQSAVYSYFMLEKREREGKTKTKKTGPLS